MYTSTARSAPIHCQYPRSSLRKRVVEAATVCCTLVAAAAAAAQNPASSSIATSITARTAGMERHDGFLPIYLDPRQGRILLEIPRDSMRALLLVSQATGLGSNPIGIDRGASGETHVARLAHDGDRVLLVLESWSYRGSPTNPDHARSIAEAFPPSTVAAMPLLAEENGRLLVDATDVALRDWNDVVRTLAQG